MDRNCPNCSVPYDVNLSKCPYCGTSYFDMSCIDVCERRPFYLKLRYGDYILTAKVAAEITTIKQYADPIYYEEPFSGRIHIIPRAPNMDIDMHFTTVRDVNDYGKPTVFIEDIKKEG